MSATNSALPKSKSAPEVDCPSSSWLSNFNLDTCTCKPGEHSESTSISVHPGPSGVTGFSNFGLSSPHLQSEMSGLQDSDSSSYDSSDYSSSEQYEYNIEAPIPFTECVDKFKDWYMNSGVKFDTALQNIKRVEGQPEKTAANNAGDQDRQKYLKSSGKTVVINESLNTKSTKSLQPKFVGEVESTSVNKIICAKCTCGKDSCVCDQKNKLKDPIPICTCNSGIDKKLESERTLILDKIGLLANEFDAQQEHINKIWKEKMYLLNTLKALLNFKVKMCCGLGGLVNSMCMSKEFMATIIQAPTLHKLLDLVDSMFMTYVTSFASKEVVPPQSKEFFSLISLLDAVGNIATVPEGRQYYISNQSGMKFVLHAVSSLPVLQRYSSGDYLNRVLLKILYNICINSTGLVLLQSQIPLLQTVNEYLLSEINYEKKILGLQFTYLLTSRIPQVEALAQIENYLPILILEQDARDEFYDEICEYALAILDNLKVAHHNLNKYTERKSKVVQRITFGECTLTPLPNDDSTAATGNNV